MRHSRWIGLTVLALALAHVAAGGLVRSAASAQQSADQAMVQHAASAKYNPFPNTPDCLTGAVERGDPASGPSVILAKFKPGCAVPWHFHTPNETVLMVSGVGRLQAKGDKPASLRAGDYAWMPTKHVHTFSSEQGCVMFLTSDGTFDIHYVDDKGNEIPLEQALKAATPKAAKAPTKAAKVPAKQ
jgi:quercetin dioxygenase-like cupin family protein